MLEKLKLTNFRKHEDLVLDFSNGLNVVRGQNEAGKSTLQEAIAYALFGSKALRTNFSDTVTWGRPESSLRVQLTLNIDGRYLTFSRGKSGAEVLDGRVVIVTGQNEASAYASNLLGCDSTAASNLIIASQNAMRGSLEQGPKATAALIEQLADFDLFDVLVERIQSNLVVGAPATFETRLREAEARLAEFQPVAKPDEVAHNAWLIENGKEVDRISKILTEELRPALRIAERAHDSVTEKIRAHDEAKEDLARAEKTLGEHEAQCTVYREHAAELKVDAKELAAAKAELAQLEKAAGAAEAYKLFKALPVCEHEFEGDADVFAKWLDQRRVDLMNVREAKLAKESRTRELEAGIITSSACGFCGQDVSSFPEVAEKNAWAKQRIAEMAEEMVELGKQADEIMAEIEAGKTIEVATRYVQKTLPKLDGLVEVDTSSTPPKVTWAGAVPADADPAPARTRVASLEKAAERYRELTAKAEAMEGVLADDRAHVERMRAKVAHYQHPADADELYQAFLHAQDAVDSVEYRLNMHRDESTRRREAFNSAMASYNARAGEQQRLKDAVTQARKDLDDLAFNNTLLKKVRTARPIIADKLWNTVLAAVSTMFSQMRGEASVVSKDNGGFKVNGQPIESLSGSTLDILGLAIRTALVKTFIPHAPFMLLDEAAAACDEDRTGSLLGFIAGSGFEQIVLVTHESASEAVADNVIQL